MTHKYHSFTPLLAITVAITVITAGCASSLPFVSERSNKESRRKYTVQLYRAEKPAEGGGGTLYKKLYNFHQEESITVRSIPLLTSKYIKDIEASSSGKKDKQKLKLHLDKFGQTKWLEIRNASKGAYLVVAVDNVYKFIWQVPSDRKSDGKHITIEGKWGSFIAEKVAERARKNYEEFN